MGKCIFQAVWSEKAEFKQWVRPDPTSRYRFFCRFCKKSYELSKMGEKALESHQKNKKHADLEKIATSSVSLARSFSRSQSAASSSTETETESRPTPQASGSDAADLDPIGNNSATVSSISSASRTPTLTTVASIDRFTKSDALRAEIRWTLKVVSNHYSYKSCEDNAKIFADMFHDSAIAHNYQCGEKKTSYLASFGIASHFASMLKRKVKAESAYVLLFDESLNHELQEKQLDIHVRFWTDGQVRTSYLTSEFLGHATASDLHERLDPFICEFGHRKLLQLSMDGPSVNWKLYRSIEDEIEKMTTCRMLQTGSCGLHILHNAFRAGCDAAGWGVDDFLCSLYHLFHDAPARREDFKLVTGCSTLPLMFCKHRWLENISVAERAIFLMPQVQEYCQAAKAKKVTCPTNNSFATVLKATQDSLFLPKLHFFLMCAREVEPFLRAYQTDRPMLPFIGHDLALVMKRLMEKFIKPEVLKEKAPSLTAFVKLDVQNPADWMDSSKVGVGFVAERMLLKTGIATSHQKHAFRVDCRNFLVAVVKKLLEKAPITFPLVRVMSWLDPRNIASTEERDNNLKKLQKTLHIMVEARRTDEAKCDRVLSQFSKLCDQLQGDEELRAKFCGFDPTKDRVDTLLHTTLHSQSHFQELWEVVKHLLLLSHGQASVERGFSVNKEVTENNLSKESLVARRHIAQVVQLHGGPLNVPISNELIVAASSARQKYYQHREDEKKKNDAEKRKGKRKAAADAVDNLKAKKARVESDIRSLTDKADRLCEQAEEKRSFTLITEANALRSKAKDKRASLGPLQQDIEEAVASLKEFD